MKHLHEMKTGVKPHFFKYDKNRITYTLWNAIEQEYSVSKTQLHCEAVLKFMSLGDTQVTNLHTFFDKFWSVIMKLEMLNASPPDAWIFDTFYSVLPNNWRDYVQKKIEEIQDSKSTAVVLDVDLLMEEIRSRLDPSKDKKNLQNTDSAANTATTAMTATTHNSKVLPNAACKSAAVIPSATPGLPAATIPATIPSVIPDPSIDDLFIDEEIQPECPLFLIPTNNWWIDYDIFTRIPTLLVQNTLNFPKPIVESDDPPTSTRDITTVGEASVRDSLEDLLIDPEITALPIPKNLTRAKASMEWKYYYKACVKEVNCLKYTHFPVIFCTCT
ncbi:hypothetical protein BDBG_02981 [Blastomyces gilchristii SLH14081]|uniref:Uncharacterized protein n=1 Tax=Blastomyces gilchristii (strain SLH14081) TaxID=559298 RepID=A0A179UHX7_BLAGS|nr:uncharacterized protein BDBG_02981 [Blastomyces gilchristii SLH14081]OAT06839.1 hypothetical protein BDBG_02981 [Blastomyces gilchristii SLH14081]